MDLQSGWFLKLEQKPKLISPIINTDYAVLSFVQNVVIQETKKIHELDVNLVTFGTQVSY